MKITETIKRECCDKTNDLKPYLGDPKNKIMFCIFCGQLWKWGNREWNGFEHTSELVKISLDKIKEL